MRKRSAIGSGANPAAIPVYPLEAPIVVREARGDLRDADPDMLIPHRKDYYLFVLVRRGDSRHWVDSRSYTLRPDTFYFTVPHQVHVKEEPRPMYGMVLAFTREFLEEHAQLTRFPVLANRAGGHELRLSGAEVDDLEKVMQLLLEEYRGDNTWKGSMMGALLVQLMIRLSRLYLDQYNEDQGAQETTLLKRFLALVGEHYDRLHEVSEYAALLHVSPGHLSDIVKQQSSRTCIEHIQNQLLVEAKRRLLHTELPVSQIGDELGFEDAAYFNRFFKRRTALTPLGYRREIREKYHYVLPVSNGLLPEP